MSMTEIDVVLGWSGPVLPIGRWAGDLDRRRFADVSWPTLPLTLADNHMGTGFVGPIDRLEVLTVDEIAERTPLSDQDREEIGESALWASGRFAPTDEGMTAAAQLAFWGRLPVSVEVRDGEFIETPVVDDDGEPVGMAMDWTRTVVGAVALERLPAFAGAWIRPDAEAAQFVPDDTPGEMPDDEDGEDPDEVIDLAVYRQAAAGPHAFPAAMFTRLDYTGPTRLTISAAGEVTGHVCVWGETHRANSSWTAAPNPNDDLSDWLVGTVLLDDGSFAKTGVIVSDGLHGDPHRRGDGPTVARRLIEDAACQLAAVTAWTDRWGIAVHGSIMPGVSSEAATRALASCPSVDQRDFGDGRGFVTCGVLMVSTCGFRPASATVTVRDGEPVRQLVASAVPPGCGCGCGGHNCPGPGSLFHESMTAKPVGFDPATMQPMPIAQASADPPDPEPRVVDVKALREADEQWRRARLAAAVAPKPKDKP